MVDVVDFEPGAAPSLDFTTERMVAMGGAEAVQIASAGAVIWNRPSATAPARVSQDH